MYLNNRYADKYEKALENFTKAQFYEDSVGHNIHLLKQIYPDNKCYIKKHKMGNQLGFVYSKTQFEKLRRIVELHVKDPYNDEYWNHFVSYYNAILTGNKVCNYEYNKIKKEYNNYLNNRNEDNLESLLSVLQETIGSE